MSPLAGGMSSGLTYEASHLISLFSTPRNSRLKLPLHPHRQLGFNKREILRTGGRGPRDRVKRIHAVILVRPGNPHFAGITVGVG